MKYLALLLVLSCTDVPVEMYTYGIDPKSVHLEIDDLGALSPAEIAARKRIGDIDGTSILPDDACHGPCRVALLSVYVNNSSDRPMAPPVVRLASPKGRAPRRPVAFSAQRISAGRTGRIRWLVSLWPEEEKLRADLSASVFLQ